MQTTYYYIYSVLDLITHEISVTYTSFNFNVDLIQLIMLLSIHEM